MASVKVAVRVRPFNQREIDMGAKLIIQMQDKKTGILNCKANTRDESIRYKEFTFDYSYWSHDINSENFVTQEQVYKDLGTEVIECAFQGYNACIFAYGQTGSGKTFTMMGPPDNHGLTPRICKSLFEIMSENSKKGITYRVNVSYLEIYQEKVADLLRGQDSVSLKVREHPKRGPYVQGLTTCLVTNYGHIQECMNRGNAIRTTAATNMNDVSSRSHAIFTITFVQAGYCNGIPSETVSKIHLVDLAGSERADTTGATGERLKEGAHINKSLVTLGSVISALAEFSTESNGHRRSFFIPYRDSVLTWLLKDSLGGNSKTIMIATISPADCNYGESLSTLRYANRAKNIINKPTVNEDPNVKLIRELREEISKLRSLMFSEQHSDMLAQLHEKEAREKELTEEWTSKWREAQAILREQRALGLRKAGPGVVLDSDRPHLVAIDDDPLSTGVTLYHLKEGETTIGTEESDIKQDIVLRGPGMEAQHCSIKFQKGVATLHPKPGAYICLNNVLIESPARLTQGCIIFLGKAHVFRFNDPAEAAELRKSERNLNLSRLSLLSWSTPDLATSTENLHPLIDDEERCEIENRHINLAKEKKDFEKDQEEFHKHRKVLDRGQTKLEIERKCIEEEHIDQSKKESKNLTPQQMGKDNLLVQKEKEFTSQQEDLEKERQRLLNQINEEHCHLQELRTEILNKLTTTSKFVLSHLNEFRFPDADSKNLFQEIISKTDVEALTDRDSTYLLELLYQIKGHSELQDLVDSHKAEFKEFENKIEEVIDVITNCNSKVQYIDNKLVNLIEEQQKGVAVADYEILENLKQSLVYRAQQQNKLAEAQKHLLTLHFERRGSHRVYNTPDETYSDSDKKPYSIKYHATNSSCSDLFSGKRHESFESDKDIVVSHPLRPQNVENCKNFSAVSSHSLHRSLPSIPNESNFESIINITGYFLRGAGSHTHYEYEVRICTVDDRWSILRRYSRFRDLHIAMKNKYGQKVSVISFPSRQLFANTESVAQSRKYHLEVYLQRLIETCRTLPSCPLAYGGPITRTALINFSPFFKKGIFESGKYGTS